MLLKHNENLWGPTYRDVKIRFLLQGKIITTKGGQIMECDNGVRAFEIPTSPCVVFRARFSASTGDFEQIQID